MSEVNCICVLKWSVMYFCVRGIDEWGQLYMCLELSQTSTSVGLVFMTSCMFCVNVCCLTPSGQMFNNITTRNYFSIRHNLIRIRCYLYIFCYTFLPTNPWGALLNRWVSKPSTSQVLTLSKCTIYLAAYVLHMIWRSKVKPDVIRC